MSRAKTKRRRKQRRRRIIMVIIIIVIILAAAFAVWKMKFGPTSEQADLNDYYGLTDDNDMYLVVDDEIIEGDVILQNGEAYIAVETVQSAISNHFYWDADEEVLLYALSTELVSADANSTYYTVGQTQQEMEQVIVLAQDDQTYISLSFIEQYTDIRSTVYEDPNRVVISSTWGDVTYQTAKRDTAIRKLGGNRSAIVAELERGAVFTVIEAYDNWSEIMTEDGQHGYIKNSMIGSETTETYTSDFVSEEYTHITLGETVELAWYQTTNTTANDLISDVLSSTKGVNVVSPTWFYLSDNEGGIETLADASFVSTCHAQGMQVWGLVSNFEQDGIDTAAVLNSTAYREQLINNLVAEAIRCGLDGINVDFESLTNDVGYGFIEFIRELSIRCRNNGLILSVDNYTPSSYTGVYYMEEQAECVDYVILMAYDEHYSGSEAGSVASLSFVQTGVENSLEMVPADQLILGIPFYTRLWKETEDTSQESGVATTSEAIGMDEAASIIEEHSATTEWLEDEGQYYAAYTSDGSTYRIWLEEEESIALKIGVANDQSLAGVAFWKLGMESDSIWTTIADTLN